MLHEEISEHTGSDFLRGVAQGCTLSLISFQVFLDDTIVPVKAAKSGLKARGNTVSGLIFADDFLGTSEK